MPAQIGTGQEEWMSNNSMVKTWIFNSIEPSMRSSYMFLETAYELWEAIAQTFSIYGYMSKAYDIHKKIRETVQGDKSVAQYRSLLFGNNLIIIGFFWANCTEDTAAYQKFVGEDRVDFLAGLN